MPAGLPSSEGQAEASEVGGMAGAGPRSGGPKTRAERIASLVGMCLGALLGLLAAGLVVQAVAGPFHSWEGATLSLVIGLGIGCAAGYLLAPSLSVRPYLWADELLATLPFPELVGAIAGVLVALAIAALIAPIASGLPHELGWVVALAVAAVLVPLGLSVGRRRRRELSGLALPLAHLAGQPQPKVVVDTSAVIDGRLLDLARAGFCLYALAVPQFVLGELQSVADSADPVRRARGRRGLAMLEELRGLSGLEVSFPLTDYPSMADVDAKLVRLAREEGAVILTVDYNLDRVAQIEGLRVLNLNQLAASLKPAMVAGEEVEVQLIKPGREPEQGVAYLDDGTMLVVEGGRSHLGERVKVTVRSTIQTASGRMVFGQLCGPGGDGGAHRAAPSVGRHQT